VSNPGDQEIIFEAACRDDRFRDYDYWVVRTDASLLALMDLPQWTSPNRDRVVYSDRYLTQIARSLLFVADLFTAMGYGRGEMVRFEAHHDNIRGYLLIPADGARPHMPPKPASANTVPVQITASLEDLELKLEQYTHQIADLFFAAFDFQEVPDVLVARAMQDAKKGASG